MSIPLYPTALPFGGKRFALCGDMMALIPAAWSWKSTLSIASRTEVSYCPITVSYWGSSVVLDDLVQVADIPVTGEVM
jgi:hypothetical protein